MTPMVRVAMLCAAAVATLKSGPSSAQAGGFVLARLVPVEGTSTVITGDGAIDTGSVSTELAALVEGKEGGFEWRVRAQTQGDVGSFPGTAGAEIKALSFSHQLADGLYGSVGKQQRVWGAGVGYQPLGFLRTQTNLRDPTDSEGRGEGVPMVYVARLMSAVTIEGVYADDLKRNGTRQWAVRGSGQLGKVEWSVLARQKLESSVGFGGSATWAGDRLGLYADIWFGPAELRPQISGNGAAVDTSEAAIQRLIGGSDDRRLSYAVGFNFTPVNRLTFTTEIERRGEGLDDPHWKSLIAGARAATAAIARDHDPTAYAYLGNTLSLFSITGLRRDYIFERAEYSSSNFSVSLNSLFGLSDSSAMLTAVASYQATSRLMITASATRLVGKKASEFGVYPVNNILSIAIRRSFDF